MKTLGHVRAGSLNRKLEFRKNVADPDAYGQRVAGNAQWQTVLSTRGSVRAISGRERFAADSTFQAITVEIRIRNLGRTIDKSWMVFDVTRADAERAFTISHVIDPGDRNGYIQVLCEEGIRRG